MCKERAHSWNRIQGQPAVSMGSFGTVLCVRKHTKTQILKADPRSGLIDLGGMFDAGFGAEVGMSQPFDRGWGILRTWLGLPGEAPPEKPSRKHENEPTVGAILGDRYRLDLRLGAGAGAAVYKARDVVLEIDVAIKVLLLDGLYAAAAAADAGSLAADLRAEARATLRLSHPNIVRVHTYERDGKWEYLVMELIDGVDLARMRSQYPDKRLPVDLVMQIGVASLDALAYAHEHGIVHNDVKPGNILIDASRTVKVCDFGLARLAERDVKDNLIAGSPVYMAPERIRGESGDGRSDVYSMGATLYALATGQAPFGRENTTAIRGHLLKNVPLTSDMPADLERIVRHALAKDPEDRFPTASAMRDALQRCHDTWRRGLEEEVALGSETAPVAPVRRATANPPDEGPRPARARRTRTDGPRAAPADEAQSEPTVVAPATVPAVSYRPPEGMVLVPERPVTVRHVAVEVASFFVDETPVTNEAWRRYLEATGVAPPSHWLGQRPPKGKERHPVVGITLDEARLYAKWARRRLPTEAEWMAVVRGRTGERRFPWGTTCEGKGCQCPKSGASDTAAVDAHPAGVTPEGARDLLGNVWEWVEPDARLGKPEVGRAIALGGSFKQLCSVPGEVPRTEIGANNAYLYLGFRCAADVEAR